MTDLNQAQLIGRLGADPEIRALPNGGRVANFSLATSEKWRDKSSGEQREKTEWHRVVCWSDGLVGVIEKYVKKGDRVFVQGQIQTRKWEKDGQERYSTEIILNGFDAKLIMLGGSGGGERQETTQASASRPQAGGGRAAIDDDIPFSACK